MGGRLAGGDPRRLQRSRRDARAVACSTSPRASWPRRRPAARSACSRSGAGASSWWLLRRAPLKAEAGAREALERAAAAVGAADAERDESETALRRAARELEQAAETAGRAEWLIERRRETPDEGPEAVRRAELAAELRAEQRLTEQRERDLRSRIEQRERLAARIAADEALAVGSGRAAAALESARDAVVAQRDGLVRRGEESAAAGDDTAATLRACAHEEAELQGRLKQASEAVTTSEVAAQQVRDAAAESETELREIAGRLGLEAEPGGGGARGGATRGARGARGATRPPARAARDR